MPEARGSAGRSHLMPKVRGSVREELPRIRGQGRQPGGATPCPRSGGYAGAGGPKELFHVQGQDGHL